MGYHGEGFYFVFLSSVFVNMRVGYPFRKLGIDITHIPQYSTHFVLDRRWCMDPNRRLLIEIIWRLELVFFFNFLRDKYLQGDKGPGDRSFIFFHFIAVLYHCPCAIVIVRFLEDTYIHTHTLASSHVLSCLDFSF